MANYTPEQTETIMQMPSAVLLGAMVADSGSKVSNIHEFFAGEQFISQSANEFPNNRLIQYMVKNVNLPKMEDAFKHMFGAGDAEAMVAECESKLDAGKSVLADDEEGKEFKRFLIKVGEVVVNSSSDGVFGTQGPRLNEKEAAYMDLLKQKLR
jgi:hypothetical protein